MSGTGRDARAPCGGARCSSSPSGERQPRDAFAGRGSSAGVRRRPVRHVGLRPARRFAAADVSLWHPAPGVERCVQLRNRLGSDFNYTLMGESDRSASQITLIRHHLRMPKSAVQYPAHNASPRFSRAKSPNPVAADSRLCNSRLLTLLVLERRLPSLFRSYVRRRYIRSWRCRFCA